MSDLMQRRIKLVAPYPHYPFDGKILFVDNKGELYHEEEGYPRSIYKIMESEIKGCPCFEELSWYEERSLEEMPEYVKCIKTPDQIHFPNEIYKVKWGTVWGSDEKGIPIVLSTNCYVPATLEEYNQYQSLNK